MNNIWRQIDADLDPIHRNRCDASAAAEVVGRCAALVCLQEYVVANLLLQPGRGSHDRSQPIRLVTLCIESTLVPTGEETDDPARIVGACNRRLRYG